MILCRYFHIFIQFLHVTAISDLKNAFQKLEVRVSALEGKSPSVSIYILN